MSIDVYDDQTAIEVTDGVYHLGVQDEQNVWANIPYLILSGDEAVVVDPGSARPEFFDVVLRKIRSVIDPAIIKHVIVQHQDPDLAAAVPLLEPYIHPDYKLYCPLEARILIQHYNARPQPTPLDDGDALTFGKDRTLVFAMTPYCHFVGSMVTYDVLTRTVFSSDAFGGFSDDNGLWAGKDYPVQMSVFLGEYLGSKRALEYALKRLELLAQTHGIDRICPQHGRMIPKEEIPVYIKAGYGLEVGQLVDALAAKHGITLEEKN
jgi:two-component system, NtrC family, C4-dicarboxylate transport sensor histidine kinase DctB